MYQILTPKNLKFALPVLIFFLSAISASAQVCNLNCIAHVNISLDEDCQRVIEIDDVLENPNCTTLTLSLTYPFGTHQPGGGVVDRSHLGHTFIYRVKDNRNLNSCWGYVTIEDKFPPQPLCKNNLKISCFQLAQFMEQVNKPQDNCGQQGTSVITALNWVDYNCDSAILGRVFRTIVTFDEWGNTSGCSDTLLIRKDRLPLVKKTDNISLNCRVLCRKSGVEGSIFDKKNYDLITFSSDKSNPNYPTPELLLKLQMSDSFASSKLKCIVTDSLLVPAITDTFLVTVLKNSPFPVKSGISGIALKDTCVYVDTCVALWSTNGAKRGGLCKVNLDYTDQLTYTCGNGFKIRRQWRISDWCLGRDTVCVQYIKVQDVEIPVVTGGKKAYTETVKPHDCVASVAVEKLTIDDCDDQINQDYVLSYREGHSEKFVVLQGKLPNIVTLPATDAVYGNRCFTMYVDIADRCFNRTRDSISICVEDKTPPTPLCDEYSQAVVDPAVCWARVYAKDLDNGSRDNCCNVLHFAIARMTDIEKTKADAIAKIEKTCGKKEYWDKKVFYDAYIENYISCYVFKDFLDLADCGEQLVVLRIYEACGVPLYDPHTFPCSEHDWYCYNTSHLYRAEKNFNWLDKRDKWYKESKQKDCNWQPRLVCGDSLNTWLTYLNSKLYDDREVFIGSANMPVFGDFNQIFEFYKNCFDLNFAPGFMLKAQTISNVVSVSTCSKYLYNDCMVRVNILDKTLPQCDKPDDLYIYCDGVEGGPSYSSAYNSYCTDGRENGIWPKEIECKKENDGNLDDAKDNSGKWYGYYGGPILIKSHDDHSGFEEINCAAEYTTGWQPVYCKEWLCLDSLDTGGKVNYKKYFWTAKPASGGKPSTAAGKSMFWIWDNCKLDESIPFTDEEQLDKCGRGWVKRSWKAKDLCGNMITCEQKIYTQARSDFEVLFPADVIINCTTGSAIADLKPGAATGNIMIMDDECELVGVHYEDTEYDAEEGGCKKIVRTWTLTDWCKFDPLQHSRKADVIVNDTLVANKENRACVYRNLKDDGDGYITYTQIIKIIDETAPVLECRDTVLCTYVENCREKFEIKFKATDQCTPSDKILYRYVLDENGDGSIDLRSIPGVKLFSETLSQGNHLLTVYATDGCGNEDTCIMKITVKDCKKPTPYCLNGIATVLMPTSKNIVLWASDFNAGSYDNCSRNDNLKFYFGKKGMDTIGFASDTFDCTRLGDQTLNIWVVDEKGNADKCITYVDIQDNNNPKVCPGTLGAVTGRITTESNEPVKNVKISLLNNGIVINNKFTTVEGKYSFEAIQLNNQYKIVPDQSLDWMNGVSTIDLMLIQQHILGAKPLNSMYKFLAADVDNNAAIDVVDLIELRKLILGIYTQLPRNTSWRFADKTRLNPDLPFNINEIIEKTGDQLRGRSNDFVGIKIGDVNQTAQAHQLLGAETRYARSAIKFVTPENAFDQNSMVEIPIALDENQLLAGFQFTFGFDTESLEYMGYKPGRLKLDDYNFGLTHLSKGYIPMSWNAVKAQQLGKDEKLFTLLFKAKIKGNVSNAIRIHSKITKAEGYASDAEQDSKNINLEIKSSKSKGIHLFQNTPNPFADHTIIAFELPTSSGAVIQITDLTGRTIKKIQGQFTAGYNQVRLDKSDLPGTGVYYYHLQSGSQVASKKMLLIE